MAYPTYRQDFEGGSTLATACPELSDVSTSPPGWSIDVASQGVTGTHSLLASIRTAASLIVANANDTLSGNVSVSAYLRSLNGGGTAPHKEYRIYGRATSTALTTGYFVDLTSSGLIIFGQTSGSTTFGPIGGGSVAGILPNNVPVLGQIWLSGTSPVTAKACAVRQDTGQFWSNATNGWTSTPTYITGTDSTGGINTGAGLFALSHWTTNVPGQTETANYADDLIYEPATQQIDLPAVTLTSTSSTQQLTAGGFTDPLFGVTWSSSDPSIAVVSATGLVMAVRVGSATITATGKRDASQTATSSVTVSSLPVFLYRIPVTIDNTANTTSALSYHQVSVSLTGTAYTSFNAHAKADGSDIRVTDSDGVTPLNFALEGIDTANSAVYLLVKVPAVAANTTRTIYVYYGNAAATSVSSFATTVGSATALTGPTDVANQTDFPGFYEAPRLVLLQHQDQPNGGGAGLNGRILLFANCGETGNGAGGQSVGMKVSTDNGVTFGSPVTLLAPAASNTASFITAVEYHDGTIYLLYGYALTTDYAAGHSTNYFAKSINGGTTWTNLSTTPSGNRVATSWALGTDLGAYYGKITETPNGDLYVAGYGKLAANTGWSSWLMKCPNGSDPTNGSNWTQVGVIAFDNVKQFSESATLNMGGSNWLAITRNSLGTGPGDLYRSTSTDGGATWSSATAMGLPGVGVESPNHNNAVSPSLLPLASSNILLSWGVRYGSFYGIGCMVSTDGGVTFDDRPPVMPFTTAAAGMATPSFGYPHAVQLASGSIVLVSFRQITAGVLSTTNVTRQIFTEDWVVNSGNKYTGCESFDATWASHGANASISSTQAHNGTNAVKVDNTAATGGSANYAIFQGWSTNTAQQTTKVAISLWRYMATNTVSDGIRFLDSSMGFNVGVPRAQIAVFGNASNHLKWYNGTAYQDTGVVVPNGQWGKLTIRMSMGPSSTAGEIRYNNVQATNSMGQAASGLPPYSVEFMGASVASTQNVIDYVDDVYTHQYTPNTPSATATSEQINLGSAGIMLGL
jgi:hypothetical protein